MQGKPYLEEPVVSVVSGSWQSANCWDNTVFFEGIHLFHPINLEQVTVGNVGEFSYLIICFIRCSDRYLQWGVGTTDKKKKVKFFSYDD